MTQSAVTTSVVRTATPVVVTAVSYVLAHANVTVSGKVLNDVVSGAIASAVALVYTTIARWLESHKASWWGRLFLIARAPAYAPGPAPQPAPVVAVPPAVVPVPPVTP